MLAHPLKRNCDALVPVSQLNFVVGGFFVLCNPLNTRKGYFMQFIAPLPCVLAKPSHGYLLFFALAESGTGKTSFIKLFLNTLRPGKENNVHGV